MFELLDNALKALAAYPPLAAFAALGIIGAGVWLIFRGERDRKKNNGSQSLPAWSLFGPAHDAMQSVHNISENSRSLVKLCEEMAKEKREQTQLLEDIRNNLLSSPSPVRRR